MAGDFEKALPNLIGGGLHVNAGKAYPQEGRASNEHRHGGVREQEWLSYGRESGVKPPHTKQIWAARQMD
jgi:hypothetical protein